MKKQIYDEKNGLNYTLHGDYYLPDLEINEEEPTYGKYGIMRKQFLKEHRQKFRKIIRNYPVRKKYCRGLRTDITDFYACWGKIW